MLAIAFSTGMLGLPPLYNVLGCQGSHDIFCYAKTSHNFPNDPSQNHSQLSRVNFLKYPNQTTAPTNPKTVKNLTEDENACLAFSFFYELVLLYTSKCQYVLLDKHILRYPRNGELSWTVLSLHILFLLLAFLPLPSLTLLLVLIT